MNELKSVKSPKELDEVTSYHLAKERTISLIEGEKKFEVSSTGELNDLILMNRYGFWTQESQTGSINGDNHKCAYVSGYMLREKAKRIAKLLSKKWLIVGIHEQDSKDSVYWADGVQFPFDDVEFWVNWTGDTCHTRIYGYPNDGDVAQEFFLDSTFAEKFARDYVEVSVIVPDCSSEIDLYTEIVNVL